MAQRLAVVALGQPHRQWDAGSQIGCRWCCGRRGRVRAGHREGHHGSGDVGSEAAKVHENDAVSLRRGVDRRILTAIRAGLLRPLGRAR